MFTTLVAAAPRALVSADGIPDFVVPERCAKVANQDNTPAAGIRPQIIDNAYQPYTRCIHSNYDYSDSDTGFKVTTAGFSPNNEYLRLQGKSTPQGLPCCPHAHRFSYRYFFAAPYEVIETDYETYSCVYSCIDWNGYKSEFGFVFLPHPTDFRSSEQRQVAPSVFRKNGVDFALFNEVAHTGEMRLQSLKFTSLS
ncbi:crustacyanin subunit A [Penaeus vannamei]|uniref:Crustacyanin subunit A n=1 Tax=Penaeus vannamei TaxID=6689 RepID=A0A3R7T092_PENVA|nr:crustacyanin subunit A [Penaeus vannamei]